MIPNKIAVTYCQACEGRIDVGGLCTFSCKWDTDTSRERPVIVATYWRREESKPKPETEPDPLDGFTPNLQR